MTLTQLITSELEIMGEIPKLWIDLALYYCDLWPVGPVPVMEYPPRKTNDVRRISAATPTWPAMMKELGFSIKLVNNGYATGSAALAVGAIMFIPFALKYGRRPMYLFSLIGQIAIMIWSAKTMTAGDLIGTNLCNALFGALAEVIVQMTVAGMYNFAPSLYVQPLTLMQTYSLSMKEA